MNLKAILVLSLVLFFLEGQAFGLAADTLPQPKQRYHISTARQKSKIDTVFPFDVAMRNLVGDTLTSEKVLPTTGQPLVLFFWLTTCQPCKLELEAISAQYQATQKNIPFRMMAISTDFPDRFDAVVHRAKIQNWPWETYWDLNHEFNLVMPDGLNGLPQVFVLDATGKVLYHKRKYQTGDELMLFEAIAEASKL